MPAASSLALRPGLAPGSSLVLFGQLAEIAEERLAKGSYVYIKGRVRTSRWEQDDQTVMKTDVVAEQLLPIGRVTEETND